MHLPTVPLDVQTDSVSPGTRLRICYLAGNRHTPDRAQTVATVCGVIADTARLTDPPFDSMLTEASPDQAHLESAAVDSRTLNRLLTWVSECGIRFLPCPIDKAAFFESKADRCAPCKSKKHGCPTCNTLQYPFEAGIVSAMLALYWGGQSVDPCTIALDGQARHHERLVRLLEANVALAQVCSDRAVSSHVNLSPVICTLQSIPDVNATQRKALAWLADIAARAVSRHITLSSVSPEDLPGEPSQLENWYRTVARNMVDPSLLDPVRNDAQSVYRRSVRPEGWSAAAMAAG